MRSWLLHLVTHAWVGRTPSLSASSVFRVLFSFYKFCWCDDLAHISMSVYRFFRASCCKWIGHRIWRLFLVIYVAQWERLTILCVSGPLPLPPLLLHFHQTLGGWKPLSCYWRCRSPPWQCVFVISGVLYLYNTFIFIKYMWPLNTSSKKLATTPRKLCPLLFVHMSSVSVKPSPNSTAP